jgi:hypothetical protein
LLDVSSSFGEDQAVSTVSKGIWKGDGSGAYDDQGDRQAERSQCVRDPAG